MGGIDDDSWQVVYIRRSARRCTKNVTLSDNAVFEPWMGAGHQEHIGKRKAAHAAQCEFVNRAFLVETSRG